MSISIKEFCGPTNVVSNKDGEKKPFNFKETEGADFLAPKADTLMVEVEGIHAYPFHTRNYTRYMPEALKNSQKRWTSPYLKPLIKHHNDQNGEIIGRIYDATWTDQTSVQNVGGLVFTVSVPDKEAAFEVENRLLETVSIGVSTNDVRCSICGSNIIDAQEGCPEGHVRGAKYNGETCYWDIYDIEPKELSYVIVPSDIYAKNKRVYRAAENNLKTSTGITEALDDNINNNPNLNNKNNQQSDNGGLNPNMDLEKQVEELQAKVTELTAQLEEANKAKEELEALKAQNEELTKTLDEVKAAVQEKTDALAETEAKLKVSEEDLVTAQQEKEAAEKMGMEAQESLRQIVEGTLNQYRLILGKTELKEEELKKRSIDSMIDSINDFKEELNLSDNKIQEVIKIKESAPPNPINPGNPVKKEKVEKTSEKTDLKEAVENMFKKLVIR